MTHPVIEGASGLIWKPLINNRWACHWQARTDIVHKGFSPTKVRLWAGTEDELTDLAKDWVRDRANCLQDEMVVFGRGGIPIKHEFDDTFKSLIACYQTDPDSPYHKKRFKTRRFYDTLCRRIEKDMGATTVAETKARHLLRLHETWTAGGKVAMGHALVGMLRTLSGFGATILESDECARLSAILSKMKFPMPKARSEQLTATQANAIRAKAHEKGRHSIALAQAFQFELMLRQKDVIGEWVPISEPGISTVTAGNNKWLRGLRWEEIDANLTLRHVTSKRQKEIEVNLRNAPMVMEELALLGAIPSNGPIILNDSTGRPWNDDQFRALWRKFATACGVPKAVRNMDSRSGAISEATDAGAELEHVRHAATHSDIGMTQRYSRNAASKISNVQRLRAEHRNKTGI